MIDIRNLSYSAGDTAILHDISLSVPKGGITALIGPNGAGKSSLLHCIAGLSPISGGTVRIDGLDPFTAPDRTRARIVALLQQGQGPVSRLRVRELVAFGRWPHHGGRPTPEDDRLTAEAVAAFDLDALDDRPLETLSGGQRQRAQVAMAYAQATPWLFLDEPLNALDPRYARDLMARLHGLSRPEADGRSIVIVLHDINAAARWADRVVAMKDGRIVTEGSRTDVLTREVLSSLFETPFDVIDRDDAPVVVAI